MGKICTTNGRYRKAVKSRLNHIWIEDKKFCTGCAACANICPKQCIALKEDEEGFSYPNVDETRCIECGACTAVCPVSKEGQTDQPIDGVQVYACVSRDEKILKESSSGGVFLLCLQKRLSSRAALFLELLLMRRGMCSIWQRKP